MTHAQPPGPGQPDGRLDGQPAGWGSAPQPGGADVPRPGRLRTVAVVLAGGTGTRVGLQIPKQLLKIADKPIMEHSIAVFEECPEIDEIVVLMTPGFVPEAQQIVDRAGFRKVSRVVEGGQTRNESTRRALDALGGDECNVLFHDAVRPLVDQRILSDCVAALREAEAVDVVIPSADTIVVVEGDTITDIPDRSRLRRGQTPQAFRLSTIRRAYERAEQEPLFAATDDCSVVLRYCPEVPVRVVPGAEHNVKVTDPVDVFLVDKLFQLTHRSVRSEASPEDYARRLRGRVLVVLGGSAGIGEDITRLARRLGATVFPFSRTTTGTDVTDPEAVAAALEEAHRASGRIDYVVNTAGVLTRGALHEMAAEDIAYTVACNLTAPVTVARAALPYLRETGGQLLLFTSSSYTRGRAGYSLYSATKAAVVNLTQALADEWSELGVRVNVINPERTGTPMRLKAFGPEPAESLLTSEAVALTSLDTLLSPTLTGQVVDVRRESSSPGLELDLSGAELADDGGEEDLERSLPEGMQLSEAELPDAQLPDEGLPEAELPDEGLPDARLLRDRPRAGAATRGSAPAPARLAGPAARPR